MATRRPTSPALEHPAAIHQFSLSPRGTSLLVVDGHDVWFWKLADGTAIAQTQYTPRGTSEIGLGGDASQAFAKSPGTLQAFDLSSGKPHGPVMKATEGTFQHLAVSADGKSCAVACMLFHGDIGTEFETAFLANDESKFKIWLEIWQVENDKRTVLAPAHTLMIRDLVFSPNGKLVASTSLDRTVRLWNVATGEPVGEPLQHKMVPLTLAFSPDSSTLLTGSGFSTVISEVAQGLQGAEGDQCVVQLWEVATCKRIGSALQHNGPANCVLWHPSGKEFVTGDTENIRFWNTQRRETAGP